MENETREKLFAIGGLTVGFLAFGFMIALLAGCAGKYAITKTNDVIGVLGVDNKRFASVTEDKKWKWYVKPEDAVLAYAQKVASLNGRVKELEGQLEGQLEAARKVPVAPAPVAATPNAVPVDPK